MTVAAFVLPLLLLNTAQDKKPLATPNTIPANAVKIDDVTYKVTEKDGKTWVYRRTPFGLSRIPAEVFERQEAAAPIRPSSEARVKVTDLGDEYKFERAHPFGIQSWKKKKSELSADEKAYIENSAKVEKPSASAVAPAAPAVKKESKN